MDMSDHLDTFLGSEPAPEPVEPVEVAEPVEIEATETEPVETPVEPEPHPDTRKVPLSALEAERKQRQDWKEQAIRADEQVKLLREQLEAASKPKAAPAPPQQPQRYEVPDPVQDPAGFAAHIRQEAFNDRLQLSEATLKGTNPDVDTAKLAERFKAEAERNPQLGAQLRQQPHPYAWIAEHFKRQDAIAEIGDPAAYRAKLEAEIRAQLAAEVPAAQRPAPQLPNSLATARSASPSVAATAGLDNFDALFPKRQ